MSNLLPSTPDTRSSGDGDPHVVGLDSDDADDLLSALSSGTARELLSALHDEPATPSAVAERIDTSLQNAQYHLDKLESADVIEVVDTVYSEKGREMNVYAPTHEPLVVLAGDEESTGGLKTALARLLSGVGVLGVFAAAVQELFGGGFGGLFADGGGGAVADGGKTEAGQAPGGTTQPADPGLPPVEATETARQAGEAGGAALPEGLFFFAGGLLVISAVLLVWYARDRRF